VKKSEERAREEVEEFKVEELKERWRWHTRGFCKEAGSG
jgi:hypothetical protein